MCVVLVFLCIYILQPFLQPAHMALVRDSHVMVKPNLESRESSM